jgi:hypothetical protein
LSLKKILILIALLIMLPVEHVQAHHSNTETQERFQLPYMKHRHKYQLGSKFVERLAWCETHGDWSNGGNWAGGLGIARSTWVAYGGRQFASTPDRATKRHQIIVANRIALWGHLRKDGRYVYPVGIYGWGGARCAHPVSLVKRRIDGSYGAEASRRIHKELGT